jgi:type IV secretion system protein VirB10
MKESERREDSTENSESPAPQTDLANDRGFSTLEKKDSASRLKKVVAAVVVLVIAVSVIGGFFWLRKGKPAEILTKAKEEIKSTLPKLNLNSNQPPPDQPREAGLPGEPSSEAVQTPQEEALPVTIDKSSSALMVTQGTKRARSEGNNVVNPVKPTPENDGVLAGLLKATDTPTVLASTLKNRAYLLAKGSFIDCVLQTKLDSTVPGMTSCVVTRNIYSDTGKVLLIERGSTVSGEYQSALKQGQARIFVLWNRVKTPNGVVVALNSPGTDSLGSSGIPGYVDTHFWERFGGAMMLSLLQDAAATAANSVNQSTNDNVTITLDNTGAASQALAVEALRNTINIPPTLYKNQGDRVGIYVARDLDFSSVYALKVK